MDCSTLLGVEFGMGMGMQARRLAAGCYRDYTAGL